MVLRTEGVRRICHNGNSAERALNVTFSLEKIFLSFNNFKNSVVIARNTRKVYGDAVDLFVQDMKDTVEVEGAMKLDTMMTNLKKAESLAWDILSYMPGLSR